jgi:hypothetical protein
MGWIGVDLDYNTEHDNQMRDVRRTVQQAPIANKEK